MWGGVRRRGQGKTNGLVEHVTLLMNYEMRYSSGVPVRTSAVDCYVTGLKMVLTSISK